MQNAIEPEVIFPDTQSGIKIEYARTHPLVFALKVILTGFIGLFIALVIIICFPISALCTFSTVATTSTRMLLTHFWARIRGKRID